MIQIKRRKTYSVCRKEPRSSGAGRSIISVLLLMIFTLCLLAGCSKDAGSEVITSVEELNDPSRRIAVATGTADFRIVEKEFPRAQLVYEKDETTAYASVGLGKVDAFVFDENSMRTAIFNGLKGVRVLDETLGEGNRSGVAFSPLTKIPGLEDKVNRFLREVKEDGTLADMEERWIIRHEDSMPEIPAAEDPEYQLVVGTTGANTPFTYYADNELTGYDIELAKRFAAWMGAGLRFKVYDYDGIVPAAQRGDIDCIFANLFMTPERAEAVQFSEPTYIGDIGVMVRDTNESHFLRGLRESFHKTFIRESRWKFFASGIGTTLLINVLSIIFGSLLGFAVFMMCRRGNVVANTITRFAVWLIQGMPVVVLLMILYYIVFGESGLSGTSVSVVAFTLIFAASVYSMLRTGVGAIDAGQTEAAYSLGYTDRKAFYRIVLPQAVPHIMPPFREQITALIKATAVVGYIAVQDLTKMGDIVRSRTYEAFFPLVAVAVIYFILAAVLIWLVNRIELRTDPRRKTREDILKGVEKR